MPPTVEVARASSFIVGDRQLELYIEYECLLAHQQAMINIAVAGLHRAVCAAGRRSLGPVDLFIDTVRTGNSSPIRLKFKQGVLPGYRWVKDKSDDPGEDLVILMPKWSAALIVVASLLVAGAETLGAVEKIGQHLPQADRQKQVEVIRKHFDLGKLADPRSPLAQDARLHLFLFEREINAPNMLTVQVDGVAIRKRDEGAGDV